jgi:hypothetical protein
MTWIISTFVLLMLWITTTWFLVHTTVKLLNQRIAFEEELEKRVDMSLRALDACHNQILLVANKPVFFDSPEVRKVVKAISNARQAVLEVIEIFQDIEIEDNKEKAQLPEVKPITSEDDFMPKSTEQLDKESREELMKKLRSGEMDIIGGVQRTYGESPGVSGQASDVGRQLQMALGRHRNKS